MRVTSRTQTGPVRRSRKSTLPARRRGDCTPRLRQRNWTRARGPHNPYGSHDTTEDSLNVRAQVNPFRFEGFHYDSGSKTYDMYARHYQPGIKRFLSQDHFAAASGNLALEVNPLTQNRYVFAGANPVDNIEFDGHMPAYETTADGNNSQNPIKPGAAAKANGEAAGVAAVLKAHNRDFKAAAKVIPVRTLAKYVYGVRPLLGGTTSRTANAPDGGAPRAFVDSLAALGFAIKNPDKLAASVFRGITHPDELIGAATAGCRNGHSLSYCLTSIGLEIAGAKGVGAGVRSAARNARAAKGDDVPRYVFRGGSDKPDNLTPRTKDTDGLSTFDTLEAATPPGGKAQVIDTSRLRCLVACPDGGGHVSIRPRNPLDLADWMSARGTRRVHPLTRELQDAIVDVRRRPK